MGSQLPGFLDCNHAHKWYRTNLWAENLVPLVIIFHHSSNGDENIPGLNHLQHAGFQCFINNYTT